MNFKRSLYLMQLLLPLLLSSCLIPGRSFEKTKIPPSPDYSQSKFWAALPTMKDSADAIPLHSGLKDKQAEAKVDVFFIYPTLYFYGKYWNADVNNEKLNHLIDRTTIRHQASVFNESAKIYAPRYRQAILWAYASPDRSGKKALDFAYQDVKAAFEYYLKNYNQGRPIIIASHSQGTGHAIRLLHEYFEKDSALRKKLVAAYVIGGYVPGGNVEKNFSALIPPSDSASQTGCVICWNTRRWGVGPDKHCAKNLECINPLTWKSDTTTVNALLGGLPSGFDKIDSSIVNVKISSAGLLWVDGKNKKGYPHGKSYHIGDYNIFWMNIRKNVKQRVDAYFKTQTPDMPYPPQKN